MLGAVGYFVVAKIDAPAVATRDSIMPPNPYIQYLSEGGEHEVLNDQKAESQGAIIAKSWGTAKQGATTRALDALLIDNSFLQSSSDSDKGWLKTQFKGGVIIVGLGVDDDTFAQVLGLKTLLNAKEGKVLQASNRYTMIYGYLYGQPDDVNLLESKNWLDILIRGDDLHGISTKGPTRSGYGKSSGYLSYDSDIQLLFKKLTSSDRRCLSST